MEIRNEPGGCRAARSGMVAFLDGELSPLEAASIERHIADCRRCTAYKAGLEATLGAVNVAYRARNSGIVDDVLLRIQRETEPVREAEPKQRRRLAISQTATIDKQPPSETRMPLDEVRAMRGDVVALHAEIGELRRQLVAVRGTVARFPPRPSAPLLFPFSPAADRLPGDR